MLFPGCGTENTNFDQSQSKAKWIGVPSMAADSVDAPNTWISFEKTVSLDAVPSLAVTRIGVDSKYWLKINGHEVVFEGGLKRRPEPGAGYYDEIDVAEYLQKGENKIDVLLWFFGKDGFSHVSSGKAGLIFSLENNGLEVVSDSSRLCCIRPEYSSAGEPYPNYRLSESNIRYDSTVPQPAGLTQVSLSFPTVRGEVSYSHKIDGDTICFTITVPKGSKAHFVYKDVDKWLKVGTHEVKIIGSSAKSR